MLNIPNQLFWCDNQEIHLGLVIFSVKAWVSLAFSSFWWFPAASVHIRHVWIILYNTTNSTVVQWTIFYTCRTCRTMYTYMYTTNYYVKCISCISYISYIPMFPMCHPVFFHLVHFAHLSRRVTPRAWARSPCGCVPSSCATCWIGPSRRMLLAMIPTPRWRSSPSYVTLIGAPGAAW